MWTIPLTRLEPDTFTRPPYSVDARLDVSRRSSSSKAQQNILGEIAAQGVAEVAKECFDHMMKYL